MSRLEDYANWLLKNKDKAGSEEFKRVAGAYSALRSNEQAGITGNEQLNNKAVQREAQLAADRKTFDPTLGMSGVDKFRAGAGKAFSDIGQGASQYLPGGATRQDVAESRRLDAPLMATGPGMAGNVAGNVAAAIPTAMIPGANTVGGSALIGAGMGALQPSVSTGETLKNIGIGAGSSAAVPLALRGGQVAKSFVDPLYQGGRDQIMGRALRGAAGNQADDAMNAMKTAQSSVPGVQYTAAEAAGNPGIAAMQRTATAANPVAMNEIAARQVSNNDALVAALKGMAPDKAAAMAAREQAAKALYSSSGPQPVQMTPEIQALFNRPSMQEAVKRAGKLAAEKGETLDINNLTGGGAHYIKMAMDDIANSGAASGIGKNEIGSIRNTLGDFLTNLEQQIPEYGQARSAYSSMSRPINQGDVIDKIAGSATNFRGNLTPAAYARALSDKTAQNVTGQKGATLAKVMEPDQMKMLGSIGEDLGRADFANTAGRGVGSDTVQKLAFSNMLDSAGVPSAVRSFAPAGIVGNVAQRAGQIVYKDANEKMAAQLAQALLNPQDAAKLMEAGMVTPQMIALMNGLKRGGTALGAATPGLVQANQKEPF
jgi:hypothetical protein